MTDEKNNDFPGSEGAKAPPANTGNASNPSPQDDGRTASPGSRLLNEKAEKYLREAGNIEDMPDAQERTELDEKPGYTNEEKA